MKHVLFLSFFYIIIYRPGHGGDISGQNEFIFCINYNIV